jgi:hypothetical protein
VRPAIDEIVTLLAKWDPASLDALRQRFPRDRDILREGIVAGNAEPTDDKEMRLEAAAAALRAASATYAKLLLILARRLKNARRLAFLGECLTLVAGASIMVNAATSFPVFVKILCGVLALAASLLGLIAQKRLSPDENNESALQTLFKKLVEAGVLAEGLTVEISIAAPKEDAAFANFMGQVNAACRRINEVEPYLA